MAYDLVIRNGMLVDGTGAAPIVAEIRAARAETLAAGTALQQQLAEQTARAEAAEEREAV